MRLKEFLFETTTQSHPALFFGSKTRMVKGMLLVGRPPRHHEAGEFAVETILEHFRPEGALPRSQSVYLVDDCDPDTIEKVGGFTNFIYSVEAIGNVEKNDVSWWCKILMGGAYDFAEGDSSVLQECQPLAEAYWNGRASAKPLWEYRVKSARILTRVKS